MGPVKENDEIQAGIHRRPQYEVQGGEARILVYIIQSTNFLTYVSGGKEIETKASNGYLIKRDSPLRRNQFLKMIAMPQPEEDGPSEKT